MGKEGWKEGRGSHTTIRAAIRKKGQKKRQKGGSSKEWKGRKGLKKGTVEREIHGGGGDLFSW